MPSQLKDDDVIPNVSEIPSMLTNIRHPRRRAVSVGPQSEADAYETLAYRQKWRKDSNAHNRNASLNGIRLSPPPPSLPPPADGPNNNRPKGKPTKSPTRGLAEYEHMMGTGTPVYDEKDMDSKQTRPGVVVSDGTKDQEELDMFSMITKPRVRYDVEVVTKLIVYSGMFHSIAQFHFLVC